MIKKSLPVVLILLPLMLSAQSPWARNKAGIYAQAGFQFIPTYGALFGTDGNDVVLDRKVSERQIQLYGEYGLSKNTTITVSVPYVSNERGVSNPDSPYQFAQEDTGNITGLGNTFLALRHQFLHGNTALAGTLRVGLPAGPKYQPFADLRTGYDAFTIQPMVNVGLGFGKVYGFAYGGYGYRSKDYSDFLNFGVEAGWHVGPLWFIGFSELVYSLENGDRKRPGIDALTGLYINDQGWLSVGVKAIWEINRFVGITASGAGAAWAQNVPKSPGLGAAFYFKWD
jgi:hypothetical protein